MIFYHLTQHVPYPSTLKLIFHQIKVSLNNPRPMNGASLITIIENDELNTEQIKIENDSTQIKISKLELTTVN